jgi:hypothetical protein
MQNGDNSGFYRIELDGNKVVVGFDEIHELRKDILCYFDENIGEIISVFLPFDKFSRPYWKFISIDFDQEWAESIRYKKVVEEGCLALLNGIALDLLDQPITDIPKDWMGTNFNTIIAYINQYNPNTNRLRLARTCLLETYNFITNVTLNDIDEDGMLIEFNPAESGKWFDKEIVQAYYQWQLEFGNRYNS